MLDVGFSELLLIIVAALVIIGPKDLPVVIRHLAKFAREVKRFVVGARAQAMKLAEEAGVTDIQREVTTIIDLEGREQQAYDVRDLDSLRAKPKSDA